MPHFSRSPYASLLGFALVLCAGATRAPAADAFKLSGKLLGSSGKNVVYVALWRDEGFLERPAQKLRIDAGADPVFAFEVPAGRWAVSAFEDRNGNGVLDMGFFGPKEPNGFWRPFSAWRKPRFDDVSAQVDRDTLNADIQLK